MYSVLIFMLPWYRLGLSGACLGLSHLYQRYRFNGTGGDVGTGTHEAERGESAAAGPTPTQNQNNGLRTGAL